MTDAEREGLRKLLVSAALELAYTEQRVGPEWDTRVGKLCLAAEKYANRWRRRVGKCARCGQVRQIAAYGQCEGCYRRAKRANAAATRGRPETAGANGCPEATGNQQHERNAA